MDREKILDRDDLRIWRDSHGVPCVEARSLEPAYWGMGYCHAMDRGMQLLLMRILGRGQASEFLDSSDATLEVDRFFRKMNWTDGAAEEAIKLGPDARKCCEAYCDGINARFAEKTPWEFKLVGYKPAPWTVEDSIVLSRVAGFVSLAQSQWEIERVLVEMVQAGVERNKLDELFPGNLSELDEELLRSVLLTERIVPAGLDWKRVIPPMTGSNNWVISGKRTASGKAMLCNDPHLEVNRLPCVWSELSFEIDGRRAMGATMPGLPALILGRTPELSWGATYTFMDTVDSWIEQCKNATYLKEGEWLPFRKRTEVIRRKKKPAVETTFYENDHGTLDGDPNAEGMYLATRWSGACSGAKTLEASHRMWSATNVEKGMDHLGALETAWNWVLADSAGNIGYQMSGLMPIRREGANGFVPLEGWKKENDWQGVVSPEKLPRELNPERGFIVTANQDLNHLGDVDPINMPMGSYRADRIAEVLGSNDSCTVEDMKSLHYDVYSIHAKLFMDALGPLLTDDPNATILRDWNHCYDPDSKGAYLFERFYCALLALVIGNGGLGAGTIDYLINESGILTDFYQNFDRILLSDGSAWFNGSTREELYSEAYKRVRDVTPMAWGESNSMTMENIFFQGKLPRFMGFDRGPIHLRGGRGTPHQGQIYRSAGRGTSFAPSYRFITEFSEGCIHSNIAGGPSDRRFSKWYASEVDAWLNGRYKKL